jgi:hypothetical protein
MRSSSKAKALTEICNDSDLCLAVGKSYDKILNFFNNFHSFDYLSNNIYRIGNESANGVIYQLKYAHRHYDAYTVLKLSIDNRSDNLMYEYIVGSFLNRIISRIPCFIGTFGIFRFKTHKAWKDVISDGNNHKIDKQYLVNNLYNIEPEPTINTIHTSCQEPSKLCILIENIPAAKSLHDMKNRSEFTQHDFIFVYYQIYSGLIMLKGDFVHNDLHNDNVLLYRPFLDKYFIYEYHLHGKITSFCCPYITKIIDYGRSYFYENETNNSSNILKTICNSKECKPDCGNNKGYAQIKHTINKEYERNISADLRLISYHGSMKKNYNSYHFTNFIQNISKKVIYNSKYTTPINNKREYPTSINNIYDAYDAIYDFMMNPQIIAENRRKYIDSGIYTCKGKLIIYDDGRSMEYIEM